MAEDNINYMFLLNMTVVQGDGKVAPCSKEVIPAYKKEFDLGVDGEMTPFMF